MREQTNVTRRELLSGTAAGSIALATFGAVRPNEAEAQTSERAPSKPEHLVHPGRRSRLRRPVLLWAARFHHAEHRPHRRRRHAVHAGLCQFRGMHRLPRGADHRALSIPAGGRSGRALAQSRTAQSGPAAGAPDPAVDPKEGRLPVDADRQVAFGQRCPISVRCRAATTIFMASAAARSTTSRTNTGRLRPTPRICGMTTSRSVKRAI